eukprot:scaffold698_cov195-Skeletonema_marinoi.AAC.12
MGSTYSTADTTDASGSSTSNISHVHNVNGFTPQEANYLSNLRDLLRRQETQQKSSEYSCLASVWKYSHLLALKELTTSSSSSPNDVTHIETQLMQQYPQQIELINNRCLQLDIIVSSNPDTLKAASRLSNALQHIICNNDEGGKNHFLEFVSNMIWRHGRGCNQHHTLDFIWNVCALNATAAELSSGDIIEFCCHTASMLHYMLQNEDAFNFQSMELHEPRVLATEASIIQTLTSSLNEYVTKTREHEHNFAGYGVTYNSNSASSNNGGAEGCITKREFSEWQRKIVPDLLYCSVVRMFEVLFFPPELPSHLLSDLPKNTKNSIFQKYSRPFPILESSKEFTTKTTTKAGDLTVVSSPVFGSNARSEGISDSANNSAAAVSTLLSPPIFAFTSISTTKFGEKWHRLYAGADGWTFQKLEHAIMGYDGPTLLVIKASSKQHETVTLGAYTAAKWERNKRDFFGVPDCFLFQLVPTLRVLKSLPKMGTRGGHYMYFHSNTNTQNLNPSKKDELAEGLGFGGTVRTPRLFIDCHLEECRASSKDTSFEEGHLGVTPSDDPFSSTFSPSGGASTSSTLHIESLEVFAIGNRETIMRGFQAQNHYRDIADSTLRNARTVDKAAFLGDMRNGVIETKAFAHRGQVDGRAHGCLKDDGKANGM